MLIRKNRSVRPVVTTVMGIAALQLCLAEAAGQAVNLPREGAQPTATTGLAIERAEKLLREGRAVEARDIIKRTLFATGAVEQLSALEAEKAFTLQASAKEVIDQMDPIELSLQKAEVALATGDFVQVELHAGKVSEMAKAGAQKVSPQDAQRAEKLLERLGDARSEFAFTVGKKLDKAQEEFRTGRYAQAKELLASVRKSGVSLTADQERMLGHYEGEIIALEETRGSSFSPVVSLAVFQAQPDEPGVVRSRQDQPAQPQENTSQQNRPQNNQPASQPEPDEPSQPGNIIDQANQLAAQQAVADADRQFEQRRFNSAISQYQAALDQYGSYLSNDERERVRNRINDARVQINLPTGGDDLNVRQLIHDRIVAEFDNAAGRAGRALDQQDIRGADVAIGSARLSLREGQQRQLLSQADVDRMTATVSELDTRLSRLRETLRQDEIDQQQEGYRIQAAEAARLAQEEKQRRINNYIDQARIYQQELKYAEALETINRLLFEDPLNPSGLLLKEVYQDILLFRGYNDFINRKNRLHAKNVFDNAEAALPPAWYVNYPTNWRSISLGRGLPNAYRDTPENAAVLDQLRSPANRLPSVQFADSRLSDVIEYLEQVTQLNVQANWNRLADVGIEPETPVSLELRNVTLDTLLDRIIENITEDTFSRPDWGIKDGMVMVSSEDDIGRYTVMHVYDISDLLHDVPDFANAPELDLQAAAQSGQGGGGQSPFRNENQGQDEDNRRSLEDRITEVEQLITDLVDPEGWEGLGGTRGDIYRYQRNLIVVNTPENHRLIDGLLTRLRQQRAMQINVETRFLLVNQDFFEQIGFDLDVYFNADNNQVRAAQANDPTVIGSDFFDFGASGPGLKRVVTGAGAQGDPATTQKAVRPRSWSPIGTAQNSLGLASGLAPSSGFAADVLGAAPALGIAGQFVDDIQVDFLIRATQADRRSSQLTAPRITFTNGQVSNIYVTAQLAYVSDLQPVVGDSAVGFDPEIERLNDGVSLLVEGTISADRRYVTMTIDTSVSRLDGFAQQAVTAVAGGQLVNSADTQSFIQLPTVTVTRVQTTVNVPDQGTLLLGGQRLVSEFEVETGVPVLSKLPVLNRFFTNRIKSKEEQTLLILVKPTILIQAEEEGKQYPGLRDEIGLLGQ